MAHYTGKNAYARFIYSGGTVVLTGDQRSIKLSASVDTVESSAGADTDKSYLTTLRDANISITFLDNGTAGSAVRRACAIGNYGTLQIGPEGTATGNPKYECAAWVTSFDTEFTYNNEVLFDVKFQKDGAWIANYEISGSVY